MLTNSQIIKRAYEITRRHKMLWLFGFFLAGGFNLGMFRQLNWNINPSDFWQSVYFFQSHPGRLAALCAGLLVFSLAGLLLTNWARVLLLMCGRSVMGESAKMEFLKNLKTSPRFLSRIIKISLLTTSIMLAVSGVLLLPPLFLVRGPLQPLLLSLAVVVFVPLAFTISCLNIFSACFAVVYDQPLGKALALASDFFISVWHRLAGFMAILVLIYIAVFAAGTGFFALFEAIARLAAYRLGEGFGFSWIFAIIWWSRAVSHVGLWLALAALNTFFNTALLLLFLQLNRHIDTPEARMQRVLQPSVNEV